MSVKNNFFRRVGYTAACLAAFFTTSVNAAWVTVEGASFSISYDDQALGGYGAPIILGDTVVFTPTDMSIESGYGPVAESWTTSFVVNPKEGVSLDLLNLAERGDYSVVARDGDSDEVQFSVESRLFISSLDDPNNEFDFLSSGVSFAADEEANLELWQLDDTFNTAAFSDGFLLTVQNTLEIFTELCDFHAFIQKKYVGIQFSSVSDPSPVPLPGGLLLLSSACAGLIVVRKGKAQA